MKEYNIDLSPNLVNLGTEGSLDSSVFNGNSLQRTLNGITVVDENKNIKIVGRLNDGQKFNDEITGLVKKIILNQYIPNWDEDSWVEIYDGIVFEDNSVVFIGYFGSGDYKIENFVIKNSGVAGFLLKLDAEGSVIWIKTFSSDQDEDNRWDVYFSSIDFFEDGSFFTVLRNNINNVVNFTYEGFDGTIPTKGSILIRFDNNANIVWTSPLSENFGINRLNKTSENEFVLIGTNSSNNFSISKENFTENDLSYPAFIKLDKDGNFLWKIGSSSNYVVFDTYQTFDDGSYLISGRVQSMGISNVYIENVLINTNPLAQYEFLAIKVNGNGSIDWIKKTLGNNNYAALSTNSYQKLSYSEDVLICIFSIVNEEQSFEGISLKLGLNLFKLNKNGNASFVGSIFSTNPLVNTGNIVNTLNCILRIEDDYYICCGLYDYRAPFQIGDFLIEKISENFITNGVIIKINSSNVFEWVVATSNGNSTSANNLIEKNKNILLLGSYSYEINLGNNSLTSNMDYNTLIATLSSDGDWLEKQNTIVLS